jgi:hypothetical protein
VLYVGGEFGDESQLPLLPRCPRLRHPSECADERPVVREDGKAVPFQHEAKMADGEVHTSLSNVLYRC